MRAGDSDPPIQSEVRGTNGEYARPLLRRGRLLCRCFKQWPNIRSQRLRQYLTVSNQETVWRSTCLEGLSQIARIINNPIGTESREVAKRFAAGNTGLDYQQLDSGWHSPRLVETLNELTARLAALGHEDEQATPRWVVEKASIVRESSQRFYRNWGTGCQSHLARRCIPRHTLDTMESHRAPDRDQNCKDGRPNRQYGQAKRYFQDSLLATVVRDRTMRSRPTTAESATETLAQAVREAITVVATEAVDAIELVPARAAGALRPWTRMDRVTNSAAGGRMHWLHKHSQHRTRHGSQHRLTFDHGGHVSR